MTKQLVNGTKLKEAMSQFGSLEKAVENLHNEKQALEKQNNTLKRETSRLEQKKDKASREVMVLEDKLKDKSAQFELLRDRYGHFSRQYDLFEGFIAMVVESETTENSIVNLVNIFQKLVNEGWDIKKKADDLRSIFINNVLGDFLKCFRCDNCGTSFIVNKEPHYKLAYNYYECPACHNCTMVKADDTFVKALLTGEQLENTVHVEDIRKELEPLRPLKLLLGIPCEICGKPITEWSESNLNLGINGFGWGHVACWNNPAGQFKLFLKAYKGVIEKQGD